MSRRVLWALLALGCLAAVVAVGRGSSGSAPGSAERVVIISAPGLTWEQVRDEGPPHLERFLASAALASLSVRTTDDDTGAVDAYVTIGAGERGEGVASLAQVSTTNAGPDGTGGIDVAGAGELAERNADSAYAAVPGLLSEALASGGSEMAVVGAALGDAAGVDAEVTAPFVLAGMDRGGDALGAVVPAGALAGGGIEVDADAYLGAFDAALAGSDVVLAELSELTPAAAGSGGDALGRADRLLGELLERLDPDRDLVVLLAPVAPSGEEQLTVFALDGPGVEASWARGGSTRRDGHVSLLDVAPTVLAALGQDVPEEMVGTRVTVGSGRDSVDAAIDEAVETNRRSIQLDGLQVTFSATVVALVVLASLLAWWTSTRHRADRLARAACAVGLSLPLAAFLSGVPAPSGLSDLGLVAVCVGIAVAIGLLVDLLLGADRSLGPLVICSLIWIVLTIDAASGSDLQIRSIFGTSPILAGRFTGFGNRVHAVYACSALVIVCLGLDWWRRRRGLPGLAERPVHGAELAVAGWFLVITTLVDGLPGLGSDVGGVITSVPAFAAALWLLSGRRRLTLRSVLTGIAGSGLAVGALGLLDLSRPEADRSHLGRFLADLFSGDGWELLSRKLDASVDSWTATPWAWLLPALVLGAVHLGLRPTTSLGRLLRTDPAYLAIAVGTLLVAVVGSLVNDSGAVVMAAVMPIWFPVTFHLLLHDSAPRLRDESLGAASPVDPGAAEVLDSNALPPRTVTT